MDFVNETQLSAGWTLAFERDGREVVVVIVKATYVIPRAGGESVLAAKHEPLTEADEFTGEPGVSAPLRETDYAHRKLACDVLFNGSAYVPSGKSVRELTVGLRVGQAIKTFAVIGDRVWRKGVLGISASAPEPFKTMPISYDNAFGGIDCRRDQPDEISTFLENPVGRGYCVFKEQIDMRPLPNTEATNQRVEDPTGTYRPMAFGAVGRNWQPRVKFAGTYDQRWIDQRAPFWPDDFDHRYFQSAPLDQQIPFPTGGEPVVLKNLTPDSQVSFNLPMLSMPILFIPHVGSDRTVNANVDTVQIEPDAGIFTMTWRASVPMRRNCFEVKQVIVGEVPPERDYARRFGDKPYYKGLAELARARARDK